MKPSHLLDLGSAVGIQCHHDLNGRVPHASLFSVRQNGIGKDITYLDIGTNIKVHFHIILKKTMRH